MAKSKKNTKVDTAAFEEFTIEFENETDRAAVVLGAAKIDQVLYQILQAHLLPSPSRNDELLDGNSALSSFSSRITMTYRLGLIDAALSRSLHMIRRIRNSFAHEVSGCSLSNGAQRDRVKELALQFKKYKLFEQVRSKYFSNSKDSDPSTEFRISLAILLARLEVLLVNVEIIQPTKTYSPTTTSWELVEDEDE